MGVIKWIILALVFAVIVGASTGLGILADSFFVAAAAPVAMLGLLRIIAEMMWGGSENVE